jgi:hypothetical protein
VLASREHALSNHRSTELDEQGLWTERIAIQSRVNESFKWFIHKLMCLVEVVYTARKGTVDMDVTRFLANWSKNKWFDPICVTAVEPCPKSCLHVEGGVERPPQ